MCSGHRSYSPYLQSVYFWWWVVCVHAHVLHSEIYCTFRGNKSNSYRAEFVESGNSILV
jgi:hypothetical protein